MTSRQNRLQEIEERLKGSLNSDGDPDIRLYGDIHTSSWSEDVAVLISELRQARHDLGVAVEALDRVKHLLADIAHNGVAEYAPGYPNVSNVEAMVTEIESLSAIKSPAKEKEGKL